MSTTTSEQTTISNTLDTRLLNEGYGLWRVARVRI